MAVNKECLVLVLDVREGANKDFKDKSIKCAAEILKDKICSGKKDMMSFVLLGTSGTNNNLNTDSLEGYLNITQYPRLQLPDWQLLTGFFKFINDEKHCDSGDWLDALVVAMDILKESEITFKAQRRRIVLFNNFDGPASDFELFDVITTNLLKAEYGLIVVSDRIAYIDNIVEKGTQPVFREPCQHDEAIENEKQALRLVTDCNAELCNLKEALRSVFKITNKRPWAWNGKLTIGSQIKIAISGVIIMKDESNIKLKRHWGNEDEQWSRERKTFLHGSEIEPLDIDLISGYMLGGTPIAFDETLDDAEEKPKDEPGLKFIGFPKIDSIPNEYYCVDSFYWIVHRKGQTASAKMLDALVRALLNTGRAMLCWKIYSAKFNNPKLVVLIPNEIHPDKPASLAMIEVTFYAQHHYYDFPTLRTEKTKCTPEQTAAIDDLIDSMDLAPEPTKAPRDTIATDLLPFDNLPHIYEQNIMDLLERKIILNAGESDEQFQKMLEDKNFVEIFWKVPEEIEEKSKQAAGKVKKLFPLEQSSLPVEKAKAKAQTEALKNKDNYTDDETTKKVTIEYVGHETPDEDFEKLLKYHVIPLKDNTTRDKKFHFYATQMRSAIWHLIFEIRIAAINKERITDALRVFRKSSYDFNAFADYNIWIREVKTLIVERKMYDFWNDVIVEGGLGLCFIGNPTLEEKIKLDEFNKIGDNDDAATAANEMDDDSVDDLLSNI